MSCSCRSKAAAGWSDRRVCVSCMCGVGRGDIVTRMLLMNLISSTHPGSSLRRRCGVTHRHSALLLVLRYRPVLDEGSRPRRGPVRGGGGRVHHLPQVPSPTRSQGPPRCARLQTIAGANDGGRPQPHTHTHTHTELSDLNLPVT